MIKINQDGGSSSGVSWRPRRTRIGRGREGKDQLTQRVVCMRWNAPAANERRAKAVTSLRHNSGFGKNCE